MGFDDISAWALIEAPHAMRRPELDEEDKQKELKLEMRLTQEMQELYESLEPSEGLTAHH